VRRPRHNRRKFGLPIWQQCDEAAGV